MVVVLFRIALKLFPTVEVTSCPVSLRVSGALLATIAIRFVEDAKRANSLSGVAILAYRFVFKSSPLLFSHRTLLVSRRGRWFEEKTVSQSNQSIAYDPRRQPLSRSLLSLP